MSKLHALVDAVTTDYERLFFNEAARAIYAFFWDDFADWYTSSSLQLCYCRITFSFGITVAFTLLNVFVDSLSSKTAAKLADIP